MIILNEKRYAENCLSKSVMSETPYRDLLMVAKYLFHCKGYKGIELEIKLIDYFKSSNPN